MRGRSGSGMRAGLLLLISSVLAGVSVGALADEPDYGTLAAAIRSANLPCEHVIRVTPSGSNAWNVECNSGKFHVIRNDEGEYSAAKAD
jgi:hypothetical protein